MPRKTKDSEKVKVLVTLFVGLLTAAFVIIGSPNLTDTNKAIGALALIFAGYAAYNEIDKFFSKSPSK